MFDSKCNGAFFSWYDLNYLLFLFKRYKFCIVQTQSAVKIYIFFDQIFRYYQSWLWYYVVLKDEIIMYTSMAFIKELPLSIYINLIKFCSMISCKNSWTGMASYLFLNMSLIARVLIDRLTWQNYLWASPMHFDENKKSSFMK